MLQTTLELQIKTNLDRIKNASGIEFYTLSSVAQSKLSKFFDHRNHVTGLNEDTSTLFINVVSHSIVFETSDKNDGCRHRRNEEAV